MIIEREPRGDEPKVTGVTRGLFGLVILLVLGMTPGLLGQTVETGLGVAEAHCASCHIHNPRPSSGDARRLQELVHERVWAGGELNAWLAAGHPSERPLQLARQEIYALETYLGDLARRGAGHHQ